MGGRTSATTSPGTPTTSRSARSTIASGRRTTRPNVAGWVAGRSLAEIVAPAFDEVEAAARSGLFDTIGHIDVVKRYLHPHVLPERFAEQPELYEPILRALLESGTALEVNTSGLRHGPAETYPSPAIVARFRELGGERLTIGSDAHRAKHFAWALGDGYDVARSAGLRAPRRPRRASARSRRARLRAVDLTVVGAGPSYTDRPGATGAAYLLTRGDRALLLDLGQGSFTRLAGLLDPADLDAVVVSHLHPDHFVDLVPLRLYLRWEPPRGRRVRVVGPAGLADRLDALHAEPGFTAAALDVETLAEGTFAVGGADGFAVEARHVTHHHPSFGFRVTRRTGRARARLLRRLRARRRPRAADPSRRRAPERGQLRGRAPCRRTRSTSTGRPWATSRRGPAPAACC